jgi:hypothetical protein
MYQYIYIYILTHIHATCMHACMHLNVTSALQARNWGILVKRGMYHEVVRRDALRIACLRKRGVRGGGGRERERERKERERERKKRERKTKKRERERQRERDRERETEGETDRQSHATRQRRTQRCHRRECVPCTCMHLYVCV